MRDLLNKFPSFFLSRSDSPNLKKSSTRTIDWLGGTQDAGRRRSRVKFTPKIRSRTHATDLNDPIARVISQNYKGLTLDSSLIPLLAPNRGDRHNYWANRLKRGASNAHKGENVGRYYHSFFQRARGTPPLSVKRRRSFALVPFPPGGLSYFDSCCCEVTYKFKNLPDMLRLPRFRITIFIREFAWEDALAYDYKANAWKTGRDAGKLMILRFFFSKSLTNLKRWFFE